MKLTMRDVRIIGESRYWHSVSKKLFICTISSIGWAILCTIAIYAMGMVNPIMATVTVNPRILASAQIISQTQDVPVTVEGNNIYLGSVRLPKEEPQPKDFTIPFTLISMGPMVILFAYFAYQSFKAGEAGTTLVEEWIKDGATVVF